MNDELAVIEPQAPLALFGTNDPIQVIEVAAKVATALADVVNKRQLYAIVNQKKFPTVEAWTLLGSMLGVFPITEWSRPLLNEDGSVRGYEARVIARTLSGRVVGAGEAMCVRGESKTWHSNAQEFALRSMAQTRATSKALRGPLDFVFKLAGFQPTPAEEMSDNTTATVDQNGVIANPSAESLKAVQGSGNPVPSSSGPVPTAVADPIAERPARSTGPRAKRGNVVAAPQATPKPPQDKDARAETPSKPTPLEDGEAEYLNTLRQQARESAAMLRQIRIRLSNIENKAAIALGTITPTPVPGDQPSSESDESLAVYVNSKFPGRTLNALGATELETIVSALEKLIEDKQPK